MKSDRWIFLGVGSQKFRCCGPRARPAQRAGPVFARYGGEHEIALQPGVVVWARTFDPAKDAGVKVEAGTVTKFPKLKELVPVSIRALAVRSDERTGQLTIKNGELLA